MYLIISCVELIYIKIKGVIDIRKYKLTEEDVIERTEINNPTIEYVSGFTYSKKKATFRCRICKELFETQAYSVYSGCNGCPNCYKNKGISNMVERLKIYNPTITYVDGYIEPHKKARFKCMKCGHVWEVTAYEAYTGSSHCPNCSKYSALFTECDIVKKLKENNPSITYIGGYTGSTDM